MKSVLVTAFAATSVYALIYYCRFSAFPSGLIFAVLFAGALTGAFITRNMR